MPEYAIDGRLTVAGWLAQAWECKRDKRDDLVPVCLNGAAVVAAEGDKTIAEYLERSEPCQ